MCIYVHEKPLVFHLQNEAASYVIAVTESGLLESVYWGSPLAARAESLASLPGLRDLRLPDVSCAEGDFDGIEEGIFYAEYPVRGAGDFRSPALSCRLSSGSRVINPRYSNHHIIEGKPALPGLPSLRSLEGVKTLIVEMKDTAADLSVELSYSVFPRAITRSARIVNTGKAPLTIEKALSASCDLPPSHDFEVLTLTGSWARERRPERQPLRGGSVFVESARGLSSAEANPCIALLSSGADETHGEVYALNLIYSGNFCASASPDPFGLSRLQIGINESGFTWLLEAGESFQTPEAVLVYSNTGLGGLSRSFHRLYRQALLPEKWAFTPRPVLVNNWEATYFNFTEEKLLAIADEAARVGMELFVLDDGWFGKRDSDRAGLGDWTENRAKLPSGIVGLAEAVEKRGLRFGLWFEPEMVNPDSDLYRRHPDWCLHVEGRRRTEQRHQLVLDLCREEVREEVYRQVISVLRSAPISYVKWDMNRSLTEAESASLPSERRGETFHRYVLGLYSLMKRLIDEFPHILFEGCASGGARFDPGILAFMPQIWTSDDTDAVERLRIQWGTSLVYPISAMGSHVSAVPNHQTGRVTPLETRAGAAFFGAFGFEMDLTALTEGEKAEAASQIAFYKKHRDLILSGDFYRLISPFEGTGTAAWQAVSEDKRRALLFYARVHAVPHSPLPVLRLDGLEAGLLYRVSPVSFGKPAAPPYTAGGDLLMRAGVRMRALWGDYQSLLWVLEAV